MHAGVTSLTAVAVLTAMVATIGCDRATPRLDLPVAPSAPIAANATSQNASVSGVVLLGEAGSARPYAGVDVWGWAQMARSGQGIGPVRSDADGRYAFTVPLGTFVRVQVGATYQPCVAGIAVVGNVTRDVYIISDPDQLGGHLPPQLLADTPTLSGLVFETTTEGRQPVARVRVELDMLGGLGDVSATTLTDTAGRYVLCGLGGHAATYVYASKAGYRLADVGTVALNGDTVHDIEIQRQSQD